MELWRGEVDANDRVELAQAAGVISNHFTCSVEEAERLLLETALQARLEPVALADRLLEPATRRAALAAVAVVADRRVID
jgi:hypothetical protein